MMAYLKNTLLEFYNPEYVFGFRDLEPKLDGSYAEIDRADLLEGSSGILLSLLSTENFSSKWLAPFLV